MTPETILARDEALALVEQNAGLLFRDEAMIFVVEFLENNGPSTSETITDACKEAGIIPHDDRAFGPVYMTLARAGVIEKVGTAVREKGHGTSGGNIWGLAGIRTGV